MVDKGPLKRKGHPQTPEGENFTETVQFGYTTPAFSLGDHSTGHSTGHLCNGSPV